MKRELSPLHPAQRDIYTDQLINAGSPHYNIGGYITLKGKLDIEKFREVIAAMPAVFDVFKMRFCLSQEGPLFFMDNSYEKTELAEMDFSSQANAGSVAHEWMQKHFNIPFNVVEEAPLFENWLIKIAADEYRYFGKFHHLLTDGYGFIVFIKYLATKYKSLVAGSELSFNYPSYKVEAVNSAAYFSSGDYIKDAEYWKAKVGEKPENILDTKYPAKNEYGNTSSKYNYEVDDNTKKILDELQSNTRAGLQHLTIAALIIYFGKTSDQDEFIFGVPVHKRTTKKLKNIVGMFSGVLPFKGIYKKELTVIDLVKEIAASQRIDYRHQQYPIGDLTRNLNIKTGTGYLHEVNIISETLNFELDYGNELVAKVIRLTSEDEQNPLQISWRDYGESQPLQLQVEYRHECFSKCEIELLTQRLLFIISQFNNDLNAVLSSINILPPTEAILLDSFKSEGDVTWKDETLISLFEKQVLSTPDALALEFGTQQLTYLQLNERVNRLSVWLQKHGVKENILVPICVDRSFEMMIGILAILKAGAAYVPIDPAHPKERIDFILKDCAATVCLTNTNTSNKLDPLETNLVIIDKCPEFEGYETQKVAATKVSGNQLAYVIYTSGSTGTPKGVMIEHAIAANFIRSQEAYFNIRREDRILQFSNYAFDASVEQIFLAFSTGATLVLFQEGLQLDVPDFENFLFDNRITHLHATPSFLENLQQLDTTYLKRIVAGGDLCKAELADRWKHKVDFYNEYGPTETTVTATIFHAKEGKRKTCNSLPIGKPLNFVEVFILNHENQLCPVGVAGEICIGGSCLAKGYLNLPGLTNEKFIDNVFPDQPAKKIYKTGDLGRWLPDGNIIYHGRKDEQLKIRGYRIEPGEIENALQSSGRIKQSVVIARDDNNNGRYLVGYIVPEASFDMSEIQNYLRGKLPAYMIPAVWVQLDHIPLNSNGKLNKKLLPDPETCHQLRNKYEPPRNELEATMAAIWKQILNLEYVGIHDNFFESGGHSLNAIQLTSRLHKLLNKKVDISVLFANPTIAQLASALSLQQKSDFKSIEILPPQEYYDLSHAQERFWVLSHYKDGSEAYNVSAVFDIEGKLDIEAFERSFNKMIERHEILRTVFVEINNKPKQKVLSLSQLGFCLEKIDLAGCDNIDGFIKNWVATDSKKAFSLTKGPLLRATLFQESSSKNMLVFTIHHIISDGWSRSVFMDEFMHLYKAHSTNTNPSLAVPGIQYRDYAAWHNRTFENQGQFWKGLYKNDVPVLTFPTDFERPKVVSFFGLMLHATIPASMVKHLRRLAIDNNMSLNNLFLSAYAFIVARYSGQQDVVIGAVSSGRSHIDLEKMIGVFVNFLPVRFIPGKEMFLPDYLAACNNALAQAYDNQDYPFDLMVENCITKRDVSRNPFFDTMLNFHFENDLEVKNDTTINRFGKETITIHAKKNLQENLFQSVLDFKLDVEPEENSLKLYLSYNTKLFQENSMQQFLDDFTDLLGKIVKDSTKQLRYYGIWNNEEKITNSIIDITQHHGIPFNICSSFVMDPVKEYIEYWSTELSLDIKVNIAPYNQVFQQLLNPQSLLFGKSGINVLFIRVDDWLRDKKELSLGAQVEFLKKIYKELLDAIGQAASRTYIPYLVGIIPILNKTAYPETLAECINELNYGLEKLVKETPSLHLLDLTRVAKLYEVETIFDAPGDHAGHMPFSGEYYAALGTYLVRKVNAYKGNGFKVLALDCDNTLWKGVCGELGAKNVMIDENYIALQEFAIEKYQEGYLLVLASKNNEADVWEVFEQHPHMKLKREHIAAHRINWEPKANNLMAMAKELNLGVNSFIFLDDSEFEISQVEARLPEVLSLNLPADATTFSAYLNHIWAFDTFGTTTEDSKRNLMYQVERQRKEEEKSHGSIADFLSSLNIKVNVLPLNKSNIDRALQLSLRTNQFNLNGARKTLQELSDSMSAIGRLNWLIKVEDRFGEYGIVGLVTAKEVHKNLEVDTFLLSCRVLGRNVEDVVLDELQNYCIVNGLSRIKLLFQLTEKNRPFQEFIERTEWFIDHQTNSYNRIINIPQSIKAS